MPPPIGASVVFALWGAAVAELLQLGREYGWGLVLLALLWRDVWPWLQARFTTAQDAELRERRARLARLAQLDQREGSALDRLIDQTLAKVEAQARIADATRSELKELFILNFSNASTVITGLQIDVRELAELLRQYVEQTERPNGRAPPGA